MLLLSYLSNRWLKSKINISLSSWKELLQGVLQASVFATVLFKIFVYNFADYTIIFTVIDAYTLF